MAWMIIDLLIGCLRAWFNCFFFKYFFIFLDRLYILIVKINFKKKKINIILIYLYKKNRCCCPKRTHNSSTDDPFISIHGLNLHHLSHVNTCTCQDDHFLGNKSEGPWKFTVVETRRDG
jgi:hypothetical protein